jgi:hypothetical protein
MDAKFIQQVRYIQRSASYPLPLSTAVMIARYEAKKPPVGYEFLAEIDDYPSHISGTVEGVDINVQIVADDDQRIGDDDVTGTFTDTFSEGCVKNTGGSRNGYEWYQPSTDTLANTYNALRKAGMSKAVATERYNEIVQQEMDADRDRTYLGVIVTLSLDGTELADNSLWGIDAPEGHRNNVPYLVEVAVDLINEGMRQAESDAPNLAERLRAKAAAISERFPAAE